MSKQCCGPGYASPQEAMQADREKLLYTVALYVGTGVEKPDYLATVDVDPDSPTYSSVVARTEMPQIGDELHHSGWNACSSCHDDASKSRRYLLMPGVRTSNINVIDTSDAKNPKLHKVISGDDIKAKTNLSAPHTVHCLGADIIISMLGDADGNGAGWFPAYQRRFRDCRPLGKRHHRHELQLRFLVSTAPQHDGQFRMGRPQHLHAGL